MEHEFTYKKERIQEIMLKTPQNSSDDEQKSENAEGVAEETNVGNVQKWSDRELK